MGPGTSGQASSTGDSPSLGRRSVLATLVALALLITSLLPIPHALAVQSASDPDVERIDSADESGYVVQVEEGESAANVLADSDAVDVRNTDDLSGEAFNGAVADIDRVQARELRKDPRIVSVERNKAYTVNSRDQPQFASPNPETASGEDYSAQSATTVWGLDRTDQRNLPLDSDYSPPAEGSGIDIYIVDSGIDKDHPEFGDRIGQSAYWPAVGDSADDCYGHGTHVAGTAASTTYGMAKNANLHSVRVLDCSGNGTLSGVLEALNWVAANAEPKSVVNLSLAGGSSSALDAAVSSLVDDGILVVSAAGNASVDACTVSPARAGPAITVGALDDADSEASFSNHGTCLDLYAPGVSIKSLLMNEPGSTSTKSGTSMAAPHVAGAVAVLWSDKPSFNGNQIRDHVLGEGTAGVVQFHSGQRGSPDLNLHVRPADSTPPNTRITSGTSGRVNSRKANFSFTSTEAGSTFKCRLGQGSWRRCTSPRYYTGLVNGKHTFQVRATDTSGNTDASPAAQTFTTAKRLKVALKTNRAKTKLRVNVNPNNAAKNYRIKVQKKKSGKWKTVRTTRTRGVRDTRVINMGKGRYRIKVPAQRGLLGAKSGSVRLKR